MSSYNRPTKRDLKSLHLNDLVIKLLHDQSNRHLYCQQLQDLLTPFGMDLVRCVHETYPQEHASPQPTDPQRVDSWDMENYLEWLSILRSEGFDCANFYEASVALAKIDSNLAFRTPWDELPEGARNFLKKVRYEGFQFLQSKGIKWPPDKA
jgi:hypothetical protein